MRESDDLHERDDTYIKIPLDYYLAYSLGSDVHVHVLIGTQSVSL